MKKIFLMMLALLLLGLCCKDIPTKPTPPTEPDTTSHNFSWTLTQLGDGASSCLYDVAIINDTLAYAVGEIWKKDSAGNWQNPPYNVARWDGKQWELMRVLFDYQGNQSFSSIKSIIAFNENDIWFGIASVIHWDGQKYNSLITPLQGQANKMWGTSRNNLYVCGGNGSIAFYNGSSWTKLTSGTSLNINDIYGAYNPTTKQWEILAVAGNPGSSSDRKILQITGTTVKTLSDNPIAWSLSGVWFVPDQHYYVVGSGIYEKKKLSDNAWINNPLDITQYYTTRVRGNTIKDVFVIGAFGEALHYNGVSWFSYQSIVGLSAGSYGSLAIKNNLIIIVGYNSPKAIAVIGRR